MSNRFLCHFQCESKQKIKKISKIYEIIAQQQQQQLQKPSIETLVICVSVHNYRGLTHNKREKVANALKMFCFSEGCNQ